MGTFFGPGPVLLYEALTASRRWQGYALRAFLLLALLVALWVAWFTLRQRYQNWQNPPDMNRYMVELGEHSYYSVAGVLLTLVLLAAPAATAGAVCLDRERGWLAHMFVTELTDAEIVLGKLVARLASVVALVIAVVPLLAISTLLGGIIPEALVYLTVTTLAIALLGCSLALALSVRAARTHEVLMLVFALWAIWLLACPVWLGAARSGVVAAAPDWFIKLNPFVLVYVPYAKPGYVGVIDVAVFVAVALVISIGAVNFAVRALRRDVKPPARDPRAWRPPADGSSHDSSPGGQPRRSTATLYSGVSGTAIVRRAWPGWCRRCSSGARDLARPSASSTPFSTEPAMGITSWS